MSGFESQTTRLEAMTSNLKLWCASKEGDECQPKRQKCHRVPALSRTCNELVTASFTLLHIGDTFWALASQNYDTSDFTLSLQWIKKNFSVCRENLKKWHNSIVPSMLSLASLTSVTHFTAELSLSLWSFTLTFLPLHIEVTPAAFKKTFCGGRRVQMKVSVWVKLHTGYCNPLKLALAIKACWMGMAIGHANLGPAQTASKWGNVYCAGCTKHKLHNAHVLAVVMVNFCTNTAKSGKNMANLPGMNFLRNLACMCHMP